MGRNEGDKKTTPKASVEKLAEHAQRLQSQQEAMITSTANKLLEPYNNATKAVRKISEQIIDPVKREQNSYNQMIERLIELSRPEQLIRMGEIRGYISKERESTAEDLYELKKFIPIELNPVTQNYIDKLLDNMGANSDFYNNAVLNLSHFYIFCLHCLMIKVYRHEERFKHLQYLKEIAKEFTRKFEITNSDLKSLDHSVFNGIEREAIVFLFHYLGIDSHSHIFQRNNDIFGARNEIAHFNEKVFSVDRYQEVRSSIENNLIELFQKSYKHLKESLFAEISAYYKGGSLDNESYPAIFEEINQQYYVTYCDYEMLASRLTSQKPKTNYYILKYANEQLGIET